MEQLLSDSNGTGHGRGDDGGGRELGRRGYLRLAGGAAASVAALGGAGAAAGAEYETVTLSRGDDEKVYLGDGDTVENVLIDATAGECSYRFIADGEDWAIRNVGIKGRITGGSTQETFNLSVSTGGSGLVENVYLGDGAIGEGDRVAFFVPLDHGGTLTFRNVHVAHWPNNGIYASAPGRGERDNEDGVVGIESSYARNNNIDGFRLGTDGSYVRDSVVHVDSNVPKVFGGAENARGVWVKDGGRVTIEDCDVLIEHPDGGYCVRQDDGGDGDDGVARVVDSRIATTLDKGRFRGNVRTRSVGDDPDVSPPDSVPMSAEEAASGGGSSDPQPTGPGLFTISNREFDEPADYEFTVDGALEATDSVNPNDEIDGSSAQGQVNGGSDTYRVAGAITEFSAQGPVNLRMDGEPVDADAPNRFTISDEEVGDPSTYQFTVSGGLSPTDSVNDNDEVSGSSADGQVNGGSDTYYYGGGIERFASDGPVTLAVNGRETDPASLLPRELRIQGVGELSTYRFAVSGTLQPGPEFDTDGTDEISGSRARGQVNGTGADDFFFEGDLERFERDGPLELYVNGERVDPDGFLSRTIRISNRAYDEPATYEFSVTEALGPTDSVNSNDEISGTSADGQVNGGADSYRFAGEIDAFTYDGPIDLYVNGQQVDPDSVGSEPSRSVSIVGSGPRVDYEFAVGGALEKTKARNGSINSGDEIDGSTASGFVLAGTDSYAFEGEITDFAVEDPGAVTIYVDGEEVDPDQLGQASELTISNRAYSEPATYQFTVSGELRATESVNPNDEISGSSADGQVNGGSDTYRYTGSVTAFENDGPVDVIRDGETVSSAGSG
jgi:hypothetical protein